MTKGIILLNKDKGCTSRDMVNKLNHIFDMKKIGHTGTLDPLATGVLVMCLGKYTKLVEMLSSLTKEYEAVIKLGIKTDTLDITGNILEEKSFNITKDDVIKVLEKMKGPFKQTVPKYSAKKVDGKKLYEYAREGLEVRLPENAVEIFELNLLEFNGDEIRFKTIVSKGTYIRSLIEAICEKLDTVGTMKELIRTKQGNFALEDAYSLDQIEKGEYKLLKASDILDIPVYYLSEDEYNKVRNGNKLFLENNEELLILLYNDEEVAIYEKEEGIYRAKIMLINFGVLLLFIAYHVKICV